ncbi:MAG: ABC-F family ATP-binding cassette domain-containing protein [Fusobacteriota bacterium]
MAVLQFNNIYKSYGGDYLLEDLNFSIDKGDKVGLVGLNGCGKTTLLKLIIGEENDDISPASNKKGNIITKKNMEIAYLSQHVKFSGAETIFEEVMENFKHLEQDRLRIKKLNSQISKASGKELEKKMKEMSELTHRYEFEEGYEIEYKVKQVLNGVGYKKDQYDLKVKNLSGGQKSRLALAKILLKDPDLLILDEPTNHLDINGIEWLESFLNSYKSACLIVSHDKYFLNKVVNKVYEIENKTLIEYKGNFDKFIKEKEHRKKAQLKAYEKQQEKIQREEEFIRKNRAGIKSKQASGREKKLERMEKVEEPIFNIDKMKLDFKVRNNPSNKILEVKNLKKSFGETKLFEDISFEIFRGDKVGIIGKNGVGKSTLLRIISKKIDYKKGYIKFGGKLSVGIYDQNHENLNMRNTIYDELRNTKPMSEEKTREVAAKFLFKDEDILKKISSLSGGEKARLAFLKLTLQKPNFLILDEPTNHLDIYSRQILENSLKEYDGTLITVSHDRHFLESVVNRIYIMKKKTMKKFSGNYNDYKKQTNNKNENTGKKSSSYEEQKRQRNKINKLEKLIEDNEKKVEKLENIKSQKEKDYEKAGKENSYDKLIEIKEELEKIEIKILDNMENWEKNSKALEELKKKFD